MRLEEVTTSYILTITSKDLPFVWYLVPLLRRVPGRFCAEPRLGPWDNWLGVYRHRRRDDDWNLRRTVLAQVD